MTNSAENIILNMIQELQLLRNEMRREAAMPGMPSYIKIAADRIEGIADRYRQQTIELMVQK